MTDPNIVAAVENSFVPLLIINNKPGPDTQILKKYKEPAWNYQVIRFLNHEGMDIIPRKAGVNSKKELAARMVKVLETEKRPVPDALRKLR